MKRLLAVALLALTVSAPAFAGNAVGREIKTVGKDSAKVVTVTAKGTAKGTAKVVKVLF